jgi:hypothetical protein
MSIEDEIRRLAGHVSIRIICQQLGLTRAAVRYRAKKAGICLTRPDEDVAHVYTRDRVARIRALIGKKTAAEIARQVGVGLGSLRAWAQHRGVSLAHPESLRAMAARLGLWIASRGRGVVSIRIDVVEDVSISEATRLLSQAAWRERHTLADAAYDRGAAILGLNGVAHSLGAAATYEPPPRCHNKPPTILRRIELAGCISGTPRGWRFVLRSR